MTTDDLERLAERLRATLVPLSRQLRRTDGGLSATQLSALGTIVRHGPIALGDLAARERLSAAMISRVATALEEMGMIVREGDQGDRRVCLVRLSERGKAWVDEGRTQRERWLVERLSVLDDRSLEALVVATGVLEGLIADEL